MATTKKSGSKKTAVKKATVKKTNPKSSAKKTSKTKVAQQPTFRSFQLAKQPEPFTSFRITRQTVYWIILLAFIIFAQLWIIKLQVEVATLLELQQAEFLTTF